MKFNHASLVLGALFLCGSNSFSNTINHVPLFLENESSVFINRWSFQSLCNHSFDPVKKHWWAPTVVGAGITFDPKMVQAGDIIFVRRPKLFFKKLAHKITSPYIIITHGLSEDRFQESFVRYLNDKNIIAWFTIHPTYFKHPKLYSLPLGTYQRVEFKGKELSDLFKSLRETPKDKLVYLNVLEKTNSARKIIIEKYKKLPGCLYSTKVPFRNYLSDMARCKFTFSPPGWGIDAFRTWESLLVGSIPIVLSSQLNDLYEGLPVLKVDSWEGLTAEFLEQKYREITAHSYSLEKIHMNYWYHKIKKVRDQFFIENNSIPKPNRFPDSLVDAEVRIDLSKTLFTRV